MFLANLFCGSKEEKPVVALQAYKTVPREELHEYQFNKSRVRYESGLKNGSGSTLLPSLHMNFLKFRNNKPLEVVEANAENLQNLMHENTGKVIKKVVKSNYEQLAERYKRSYQKFYDADFKPSPESIGKTFARKNCEWKRISQIIPNAEFVCDDIAPEDILQGELGNCYFLSAIAALAEHDFRIKNIFPNLQVNKNGLYMARILHQGVFQEVIVDDYIPVDSRGKPIFAKPSGGKQIWVMILQKCWAKLFGSYEAIVGGLPNQVLHAFSSAPTFYHAITSVKSQQQELFETLLQATNEGAIMCCGTKSDPHVQTKGLVLGHAYTLLDVFEKPYRMLKIRNPWGEKQWNGRASEMDKVFWQKISPFDVDRLGHTFENDGTFFMLWEDFVQYFSMLDICKVNDNANYYSLQNEYVDNQPKMFEFETSGGDVVITLSQKNIRGLDWRQKKKGYGAATLVVSKQVGQGQSLDYKYIESDQDHSFSDFSIVLKKLQKGKYTIYSSMKWTRSTVDFATISVYTQSRVTLKEAPKTDPQDFLYKTYLNHASNNTQNIQVVSQRPYEWACSDLLSEKCGFGYLAFHVDKTSKRKIGLQINERDYTEMRLELMAPYKGKGVFKLTAEPGKEVIVMFKMVPGNYAASFTLPVPKMFLLS